MAETATKPKDDPGLRLYRCVDALSYEPTPCDPFKSSAHLADKQVTCPSCGSASVRPWPPLGEDAP